MPKPWKCEHCRSAGALALRSLARWARKEAKALDTASREDSTMRLFYEAQSIAAQAIALEVLRRAKKMEGKR